MENRFIPKHGGYRKLLSYQKAEIIYDATYYFTKKFLKINDRTVDQMVQAARSGKQNIAEGSKASATSKETELRLTNVARASLQELLVDYEDFLRVRKLPKWEFEHPYSIRLAKLIRTPEANYETFKRGIEHENPEICANVVLGLIRATLSLLTKLINRLEDDFINNGSIKERMSQARLRKKYNK